MTPKNIPIPIPGGLHTPLPSFAKIEQKLSTETIDDLDQTIKDEFSKFLDHELTDKSIAIGVGSRGIKQQPIVVKALVAELLNAGAKPFIVPAMGSHGGGSAEGQTNVLASYGITEATMGAPVRASMDVVKLGAIDDGTPVYCDRLAHEADYIIPCNRVKPHTSFRAKHESGLIKMLAIGLSKHEGATAMHFGGMQRFGEVLPKAAKVFLEQTKILFGVAMVENAQENLRHVELVKPDDFFKRDSDLLVLAKKSIPQLLFKSIDLLIIDEIGKNISGAGMDPNITGRTGENALGFDIGPSISTIAVLDLTDVTQGNATGIGMADVTTQRVVSKADWTKTYVNIVTSGSLEGAKLPLVANTDRDAIGIGIRGCTGVQSEQARIVRIANTLEMTTVWASEPLLTEVSENSAQEKTSELFPLNFDEQGSLVGHIM